VAADLRKPAEHVRRNLPYGSKLASQERTCAVPVGHWPTVPSVVGHGENLP